MPPPRQGLRRALAWLRAQIRSSELWLVFVAVLIGAAAGGLAIAQGAISHAIQVLLFGIEPEVRLSAAPPIAPIRLIALPVGGLILGGVTWAWTRRRPKPPVDPVEANALRGGRMSLQDSAFVTLQTLISNGFGASVGLEAAYAQTGASLASRIGVWLNLRRADLRILVGAGAGAAIAAAFGAPLAGAFYGSRGGDRRLHRWPAVAPGGRGRPDRRPGRSGQRREHVRHGAPWRPAQA